jgi:uncharacterized protein (TIGR03437 family)
MPRTLGFVLATSALLAGMLRGQQPVSGAPVYTAESIVHGATWRPGALAPNTLIHIFGRNLAERTHQRSDADASAGSLPFRFPMAGTNVIVNGLFAALEFVSPGQVTAVLPSNLEGGGEVEITVVRGALRGPRVRFPLVAAAPGLFQLEENRALARPGDSDEFVTAERPLRPGSPVRLYATGLGHTDPPLPYLHMAREEAEIVARRELAVLVNGEEIPKESIRYAGLMPGIPGVYEIRLDLPLECPESPEIQLRLGGELSPAGVILPVVRSAPPSYAQL